MTIKNIEITNDIGLHASARQAFTQKATFYKNTNIWIEKGDIRMNAKSMLGLLSMGICKGDVITIMADGEDEVAAVDALVSLIMSGFNL